MPVHANLFTMTKSRMQGPRAGACEKESFPDFLSSSWPAGAGHPATSEEMVEVNGIEPMTSCLQSRRSPS